MDQVSIQIGQQNIVDANELEVDEEDLAPELVAESEDEGRPYAEVVDPSDDEEEDAHDRSRAVTAETVAEPDGEVTPPMPTAVPAALPEQDAAMEEQEDVASYVRKKSVAASSMQEMMSKTSTTKQEAETFLSERSERNRKFIGRTVELKKKMGNSMNKWTI